MNWVTLLKRPAAYLPVAMSLAALSLVVFHVLFIGTQPEADEGTSAHLFQLLMVVQLPIIGVFALSWLPKAPRAAVTVLSLQLLAALAAFVPLYILEH